MKKLLLIFGLILFFFVCCNRQNTSESKTKEQSVDLKNLSIYEDYIIQQGPIVKGGREYYYRQYFIFADSIKAPGGQFRIDCYDYGDTTLCYTNRKDMFIVSGNRLSIIRFGEKTDLDLPKLQYRHVPDLDTLLNIVEITKNAPLARFESTDSTEGVVFSMRDSVYKSNFKVSYDKNRIKFTNIDGTGFFFSLAPPVKGEKSRNVMMWRNKLPPFIIYNFEVYYMLFRPREFRGHYKLDANNYF